MILVIYAPCLTSPANVFEIADDRTLKASQEFSKIITEYIRKGVIFYSYPCPESLLLGHPRPAMDKEGYKELGILNVIDKVSNLIKEIIEMYKPKKIVFIGIEGSPTCGVNLTYIGNAWKIFKEKYNLGEFKKLPLEERLKWYSEFKEITRKVKEPGILVEELKKKYNFIYVGFDKKNIKESIKTIKEVLNNILKEY